MPKIKNTKNQAEELINREIGNKFANYRFSHYRFELEIAPNDSVEELQRKMDRLHLD